jgi:hypothetical protein
MHALVRTLGAVLAAFALVLGMTAAATAGTEEPEADPCITQQTQVTKAEEALAKVTAVFAKQKVKVAKAKKNVKAADTKMEKAKAKAKLTKAKEDKAKAKKAKKAQQMRLAKALERLAACEAAQEPVPDPAPVV